MVNTRLHAMAFLFVLIVAVACGSSDGSTFPDGAGDAGLGDSGGGTLGDDGSTFGSGDGSSGGVVHATALAIDPPSQTLTVDGVTPASAVYHVNATLDDGTVRQVAAQSLEFDRPDLASLTPGVDVTLTASGAFAGTGTLHAVYGGATATATLTVKVNERDLGGVDPGVAAALDAATGADPSLSSVLYPYDATVWPLGLTSPLVMWNAPAAGDVYRLHLAQANYTYDLYSAVAPPARLRVDQSVWDRVTASNAGGAADPLTITLSRYDAAAKKAYSSAKLAFTIAPASLRGAIYYWSASFINGVRKGHIARFRPGTGATPEPLNQGRCMGCHAVSADGTTLVADVDDQNYDTTVQPRAPNDVPSVAPYGNWSNTRAWASFDLTQTTAPRTLQTNKFGGDIALSPDAKYVVFGGRTTQVGSKLLSLGDPKTGTVYAASGLDAIAVDSGAGIMQPAFAPDGKKLGIVMYPSIGDDNVIPTNNDTVGYLDFDPGAGTFKPTVHKLATGSNAVFGARTGLAYPSFTPDSNAIAFHAGTQTSGCHSSCDDNELDDGDLWMIGTGGGTPVRLGRANDPPDPADRGLSVEPTFNPAQRGGYAWVVFTSMRNWGNKLTGTTTSGQRPNGLRRLWVAAIDPTLGTVDPSHPAIYLEGQEDLPNMRGFWALASCTESVPPGTQGGACGAGFECCSGLCDKGHCVDASKIACKGVGDDCATGADCCNPDQVECTLGKCTPKPIK